MRISFALQDAPVEKRAEALLIAPDKAAASPASPALTVYFDGGCPVCRREITHYRRLAGAEACQWVDAAACADAALGPGLTRSRALGRFHVRRADGQLLEGAPGFAALWSALPGWAWLGRLVQAAPVRPLAAWAYSMFLRCRPLWRRPMPVPAQSQASGDALPASLPTSLLADLRSDQAGEAGAVQIYAGMLATSRHAEVRRLAQAHRATEAGHLVLIEPWVPHAQRSRLLPLWRLAGWLTGALAALAGPRAVYATVAAVETFVDQHYAQQLAHIDALAAQPGPPAGLPPLRSLLAACRDDELQHRDEALALRGSAPMPALLRLWLWAVAAGSAGAVALARRF